MSSAKTAWTAKEATNLIGADRKITVTGSITTSNTSEKPELFEAVPQGINPQILVLELRTSSGLGGTVMGVAEVKFEKPVSRHQYTKVTIRSADGREESIDVQFVET